MYIASNQRIVDDQARFSFNCPNANTSFSIVVKFVAENEGGRVKKGVKIELPMDTLPGVEGRFPIPLPPGVQLRDEMGNPIVPGDGHVIPKRHSSCSVDVGGENYELFSVNLVDQGEDDGVMRHVSGGVLYFPDSRSIPPELGGEGVLMDNPHRGLE